MDDSNEMRLNPELLEAMISTPLKNMSIPKDLAFNREDLFRPIATQIDPKSTVQHKVDEQTRMLRQQLEEQNKQLVNNYNQLQELYKLKEAELQDSKKELHKSRIISIIMLIVALISMGITAAPYIINFLSKVAS